MIRGFLYVNNGGWPVAGIIRSGSDWVYWDYTPITEGELVWQSGFPGPGDIAMIGVQGLTLFNGPENVENYFPCIAPALALSKEEYSKSVV
uniref:C-type lectin domain-containing protein n=3 Tax=Bursaphelenchus xylophilus TaxID=6326 RepID=A0A1I7RN61_BURXY